MAKLFRSGELEGIARALGGTDDGLSNSEIDSLFAHARLIDPGPGTKWKRIYSAFATTQNKRKNRTNVLEFIRQALAPIRYTRDAERFEHLRSSTNQALLLCGLEVTETGELRKANAAKTISEAHDRARSLRSDLISRGVHPDVLKFCKSELLADNYFHAVLEAVKSISDKIREITGVTGDGGTLIDKTLTGSTPLIAINKLETDSEKSEQKGFANLVKGTFGMFRNPTAHEARILWKMNKKDAEDLLSLVSLIHRRLDKASN